jgi:hypothetical protein
MAKFFGLSEIAVRALAILFWVLFILGGPITLTLVMVSGSSGLLVFGICVAATIVPAIFFSIMAVMYIMENRRLEPVIRFLMGRPHVRMEEIAAACSITPRAAEERVARAIERDLIKGFIDPKTKEFHVPAAQHANVQVPFCPYCQARINMAGLPGQNLTCPYCGRAITAGGPSPQYMPPPPPPKRPPSFWDF